MLTQSTSNILDVVETELRLRSTQRQRFLDKLYPSQRWPSGDWYIWLLKAGRGYGKTMTGAFHVVEHCRKYGENARIIILAPTIDDARSVCLEGESGLVTLFGSEFEYNKSLLALRHRRGGHVKAYGAEKPARLRGPQSSLLWVDEVAIIDRESLDNAHFGLRVGDDPRAIYTTTPKNTKAIRELVRDANEKTKVEGKTRVVMTEGTTFDNVSLPATAIAQLESKYGGTRLGRQELLGELIEEAEGAMWKSAQIERDRIKLSELPQVIRTVIALDPAVTKKKTSDFTGLAAASKCVDDKYYLRHSEGIKVSPSAWARRAIDLFHEYDADLIVGEINNGGDMIEETLRAIWPEVPFKTIHASRGKRVRAEPVSLLSEQGRVPFVGEFPSLEDQLLNFGYDIIPDFDDELDAFVYSITELAELNVKPAQPFFFGRLGNGYIVAR